MTFKAIWRSTDRQITSGVPGRAAQGGVGQLLPGAEICQKFNQWGNFADESGTFHNSYYDTQWSFICLSFSCQSLFGHVSRKNGNRCKTHIWNHQYYLWFMMIIFISKLIFQVERDGSIIWWHQEESCMEGLPSRGAGPSQALILRNIGSSTIAQGPRMNKGSSTILAMAYTKAGHNHGHGL